MENGVGKRTHTITINLCYYTFLWMHQSRAPVCPVCLSGKHRPAARCGHSALRRESKPWEQRGCRATAIRTRHRGVPGLGRGRTAGAPEGTGPGASTSPGAAGSPGCSRAPAVRCGGGGARVRPHPRVIIKTKLK